MNVIQYENEGFTFPSENSIYDRSSMTYDEQKTPGPTGWSTRRKAQERELSRINASNKLRDHSLITQLTSHYIY